MTLKSSLLHPFNQGWVLYLPATDRLMVLNQTGKSVWEMFSEGFGADDIAEAFAERFGIPGEQAVSDIGHLVEVFEEASQERHGRGGLNPRPPCQQSFRTRRQIMTNPRIAVLSALVNAE